jgi:hypothetical protein
MVLIASISENMKRCLTLRIKCDREYAIALNAMVLQVPAIRFLRQCFGSGSALILVGWGRIRIHECKSDPQK